MTTIAPQIPLRTLVRQALDASSSANPKAVADQLLGSLSDDHYREAAHFGLRELAMEINRSQRTIARASGPTTSTRWGNASRVSKHSDVLKMRVNIGGSWKLLRDCNAVDLELAADWHLDQSGAHKHRSGQYLALASKLPSRTALVKSLPRTVVEGIVR